MSHLNKVRGRRRLHLESLESRRMLAIPGSLDNTFSDDGKVTVPFNSLSAVDVAVQADGKPVVAGLGFSTSGEIGIELARFSVDGLLDPTFSGNGIAFTPLTDLSNHRIHALTVAPNGKIIVVGGVWTGAYPEDEVLVYCYNTDGTVDTTFGDDGRVVWDLGDVFGGTEGFDVTVQPDGQIVVVGKNYKLPDQDFLVMRLHEDGSRDVDVRDPIGSTLLYRGFDVDGVKNIGFGGDDTANAVALDSAGNIYVAGTANISGVLFGGVTKLSKYGGFVSSFDNDGKANFAIEGRSVSTIEDLILQGDKVVIAGHSLNPANGQNDFYVARFTSDGQLDTTFGEGNKGFTVTDLGGNDVVAGITVTPTGGGGGFIVSGGSNGMAAVKYTVDGLLDTSFGVGGKVKLAFGGVANIAPGPGRRIMLAGGREFATARLLLAGAKNVSVSTGDAIAVEGTTNTATLFVGRTERLPWSTRVFFGVGGTATYSSTRTGTRDYSMPAMAFPVTIGGSGFVDIPANETLVQLTLTTVNDSLREGNETASFTIVANSHYEVTSPGSVTITIQDDDTPNSSIGKTTVAAPSKQVRVDEELQAAVTWTVPSGGWRQLSAIQLRLRDLHNGNAISILTFDEATNSFSVDSSGVGASPVTLVLSKCTFQAAGPTAPTVKVIFTFRFNAAADKRRFALDVAATNDIGAFSGFDQVGEFLVHKKKK
jgi:uncharacterized delta-60 repeat protein